MNHSLQDLYGNQLAATDGTIGHVKDIYFDDMHWVVRYVVADTGTWLSERLVLLSPHAFGPMLRRDKTLRVNLTREQIEHSPSTDTHRPVSRQYEEAYHRYYGWPSYWEGDSVWGVGEAPVVVPPPEPLETGHHGHLQRDDVHLRSARSLAGYAIAGTDGPLGTLADIQIVASSWRLANIVVESGHWFSGKQVLISVDRIAGISYESSTIQVRLSQTNIRETANHDIATTGTGFLGVGRFST